MTFESCGIIYIYIYFNQWVTQLSIYTYMKANIILRMPLNNFLLFLPTCISMHIWINNQSLIFIFSSSIHVYSFVIFMHNVLLLVVFHWYVIYAFWTFLIFVRKIYYPCYFLLIAIFYLQTRLINVMPFGLCGM